MKRHAWLVLLATLALGTSALVSCGDDDCATPPPTTGPVCGNGIREAGEACDGMDFGDESCLATGSDGGELICGYDCSIDTSTCCNNSCDAAGDTQCGSGEVVQACELAVDGCLAWAEQEDCAGAGDICVVESGTANCAPTACESSADCAEPTPLCDIDSGTCVECLVEADCGTQPGKVCVEGGCACPGGLTYCGPNSCVDVATDAEHCGACGHYCYGECAASACVGPWEPIKDRIACPACTDTVPEGRREHVSVWTGDRLIIWGGEVASGFTQTGGLYDHAAYVWQPTSLGDAPSARDDATAVWTGTEMIVWGGKDAAGFLNTGGRFDPATNTWLPMTTVGAPDPRIDHVAVWTGSHMIVYGGYNSDVPGIELGSGGSYDPSTDTWTAITSTNTTRRWPSAVWNETDGVMLVYGGFGDGATFDDEHHPYLQSPGGHAYVVSGDSWSNLNIILQPEARSRHTAVFDGANMLLWGGFDGANYLGDGKQYTQGAWQPMAGTAPAPRRDHTAVWIQSVGKMIVWGGWGDSGYLDTGGEYDSATNEWVAATPTAPEGRSLHTAVTAGDQMMVWGGEGSSSSHLGSGAVYTPQ